jgi:hypothetical protein
MSGLKDRALRCTERVSWLAARVIAAGVTVPHESSHPSQNDTSECILAYCILYLYFKYYTEIGCKMKK